MYKKFCSSILVITMIAALSGCSTAKEASPENVETVTESAVSSEENTAELNTESTSETPDGGHAQGGPGGGNGHGGGGGGIEGETDSASVDLVTTESQKFVQETYDDPDTGISLEYSLYVPESYDESTSYPLLMYIPDATGAGKTAKEIVEQYYGADVWVTDEDQAKHASFVVVPAFSEVVVNDDNTTSDEIDAAVNLLNYLTTTYNIDTNRLYTTGQSMRCMTSIYLNSKYPDLFAASLFVSGQWDISVLEPLLNEKFFYITAGGDEKASGGQDEVMNMFDENSVNYTYETWSAQDSEDTQNAAVEKMLSAGANANMIRFETGTVLDGSSDMEHMASFKYGYKISAVRDWLFEQSK